MTRAAAPPTAPPAMAPTGVFAEGAAVEVDVGVEVEVVAESMLLV